MDNIPEKIYIKEGEYTRKKSGPPTTEQKRRKNRSKLLAEGKAAGNRHHYTDKEKMEVACTYAVTGNSRRTAEITGYPEGTIRAMKTTEWFHELQSRIIKEQDEELGTKLTQLIDKAVDNINDRLDDGDYFYDAKNEMLKRKPMTGKDVAIVGAILVDKRQLLRGQPTSRVEKVSQEDVLGKLAEQFRQMATTKTVEHEPVKEPAPIDAEFTESTP
jgi:hypothetical protein